MMIPRILLAASLALPAAASAQVVQGRLMAAETEEPVRGGMVHLIGADSQAVGLALTDAEGRFTLQAPRPGQYWMMARAPGYEASQTDLFPVGAQGMRLRFVIHRPPVVLDTVTAVGISPADRWWYGGFHERMARNVSGRFITAEEIERWHYIEVADALRSVPSLEVVYTPRGARVRLRNPVSLSSACWSLVYLNGMRVDPEAIQNLAAADIEGIEVYTRGDAPAEYNSSMGASCGVIVVWLKAR
ncbi:MAG TPA: carboxypeptidase regulatory-like domain-containing protein [Longimicrobium sp.]|nr:carboxypeptidase regulatory-like domain-containing protein [Longimicrobium sp.]